MHKQDVQIITGNFFTDNRGTLKFVNDFNFSNIKRFYCIHQSNTSPVRAWQGHKVEHKHFYVAKGKFALAWVKIDSWENPSFNLTACHLVLEASSPQIISIPPGHANGIKALEPESILMVYSSLTLQQSSADRWTFEPSLWMNWDII